MTLMVLLAGCATRSTSAGSVGEQTFLGLVTVKDKSFAVPGETTFPLSANEISPNAERTGREVRLFWGLITYTDY